MNDFEKKLYDDLLDELAIYADLGAPPVRRLTGALASISEAIEKLKNFVAENAFAGPEDEVAFFKYTKPAFLAEHFYALEIFNIESTRPLNDITALTAFYGQELKYVQRFFDQQKFLYAYYQGDMKELDKLLFVPGAKPADIPVPDVVDLDPAFGTCGDKLFAKFRAFERLREYLLERLYGTAEGGPWHRFKWSGDKSDLTELAYALFASRRINKGEATILEIIEWLDETFGAALGRSYRRFSEIKMRKVASRTKFLEELAKTLQEYMDDADAWKPKK